MLGSAGSSDAERPQAAPSVVVVVCSSAHVCVSAAIARAAEAARQHRCRPVRWEWRRRPARRLGGALRVSIPASGNSATRRDLPGLHPDPRRRRRVVVLQPFTKPADDRRSRPSSGYSGVAAISRDDEECVFSRRHPAGGKDGRLLRHPADRPAARPPFESDARAMKSPDPPCGDYGWSTHGDPLFHDRHPVSRPRRLYRYRRRTA